MFIINMDYKKEKIINFYQSELNKMWSQDEFIRCFGPHVINDIIKYNELHQFKHIDELIPNEGYKIILIEQKKNVGHWCVLIKKKDSIIWFDSYGIQPDNELNFISKVKNKMLKQEPNQIRRLMATCDLKRFYSKTKYQKIGDHISTCGRWVALAIFLLYQLHHTLPEMKNLLDNQKQEQDKPYDILVIDFTS